MSEPRRRLPGVEWLLLAVAVAEWVVLKFLDSGHPPALLAVLVLLAGAALAARLLGLGYRWWRCRRHAWSTVAEAVLLAGVLVALGGGMANWALGLQGAVILHEGETAVLRGGAELQEFAAGPFARLEEMDLSMTLKEVELVPAAGETFSPKSLLVLHRRGKPFEMAVAPGIVGRAGSLRFFQGVFGFAPRIVIQRSGEDVFDRVVPFLTDVGGPQGTAFAGRFTVASESLEVAGEVDLSSLDERLRGHPRLQLQVWHEGVLLGQGNLLPGHFAELEKGFRVGFAGLLKWSEIDVFRRNYSRLVFSGGAVALLGGLAWPLARWRGL